MFFVHIQGFLPEFLLGKTCVDIQGSCGFISMDSTFFSYKRLTCTNSQSTVGFESWVLFPTIGLTVVSVLLSTIFIANAILR